LRREFLPDLAKWMFRDVCGVSCALAALQLWPPDGRTCIFSPGRVGGLETAEQAKKIIRAVASFRSTSALDRTMHVANGHRALRLAPLPRQRRWASARFRRTPTSKRTARARSPERDGRPFTARRSIRALGKTGRCDRDATVRNFSIRIKLPHAFIYTLLRACSETGPRLWKSVARHRHSA
jgi:hypothetical protein